LLVSEHELLLVSNGEAVAHRARMPMLDVPSESLIREERNRR
jgi:hypothetical protein